MYIASVERGRVHLMKQLKDVNVPLVAVYDEKNCQLLLMVVIMVVVLTAIIVILKITIPIGLAIMMILVVINTKT